MKQLDALFTTLCACLTYLSAVAHGQHACSGDDILWMWKGALSAHSVTFKFGLKASHTCTDRDIILHLYPQLEVNERPHSSIAMCSLVQEGSNRVMICPAVEMLHANRKYRYELSLIATADVVREGTFRTPGEDGSPFSFRMAFSSCADENSDPQVFKEMASHDPLFFLHMGDLHYHNIDVNDPTMFRNAYHSLFASPSGQAMLEMDLPFAYMWDDHDYGPDNSDKTAAGRDASVQVYREFVPHYDLPGEGPLSAIYQAFTIGRVRFILTDLRSERTPNLAPNVPSKSVLGVKQKKWFKEELVRATTDPDIKLIVWCSTMPWIDDERKWGYFQYEQQELINYMKGHALNTWVPIVIVSGDAHMLAVDDGTYSPGNLTTFHAAALGRPGSTKGGPYSHGLFAGSGQYGLLDVKDDGHRVCLYYRGMNVRDGMLLEYDTCHPERTPSKQTYFPPPIPVRMLMRWYKKKKKFVGSGSLVLLSLGIAFWWNKRRQQALKAKKRR